MSDRDRPAPDKDADLARAFAALRREEQRAVPAFSGLEEAAARRRRARPTRPLALAAAGAAAAAAILVVVLQLGRPTPPPAADLSRWRPATDFLLRTPGREILGAPLLGRGAGLGSLGFEPSAPPNAVPTEKRRSS